jgi:Ca2+-binding RTX toxin-like protein
LGKRTLASQQRLFGADGGARLTIQPAFGGGLSWTPDGRWLFASSGGICRDRAGIYRIDVAHRTAARLTNDCHVRGTPGADNLTGTSVYDILLGYAGNDHLTTVDGNYQGDDAYGGPGDDELDGGWWPNTVDGGPGNDVIHGGPSRDTIIGGPGHDELFGDGGSDHIYARDGARDLVDCGWNHASTGPDTAWVDKRDVVRNCRRVVRG